MIGPVVNEVYQCKIINNYGSRYPNKGQFSGVKNE